jgi:hypothetical protein
MSHSSRNAGKSRVGRQESILGEESKRFVNEQYWLCPQAAALPLCKAAKQR